MTKAREIISYGGAVADGWRQYAHRMLHYGKALHVADERDTGRRK